MKRKGEILKNWLVENWVLLLALGVSFTIQLLFITKSSIWHDEGYSLWLIEYAPQEIISRTIRDVHPPLYYEVLKLWTYLFGTSEMAARSLSSVCILGVITYTYFLVKQLFGNGAARATALFMSVAPFLIRYGQEARMYAMVALFISAATYYLVTALNQRSKLKLFLYALFMALAFYTHYYSVFMLPVQWLYVLLRTNWKRKTSKFGSFDLLSPWWWLANIFMVLLFIPWLPSAYQQFSRVQTGFWIPAVSSNTLPSTTAQFLQYSGLDGWTVEMRIMLLAVIVGLVTLAIVLNRKQRKSLILLAAWAAGAPLIIFTISMFSRPVYVDRYFVYAAAAFYALLAVLLYLKPLNYLYKLRPILLGLMLAVFISGVYNVYQQSGHQMRTVANFTNRNVQAGDQLISGELYTYLDFRYYNKANLPVYLYAPTGISGYGETSLFYDQPQLIIPNYDALDAKRVWLIGKTGDKAYYREVPANWKLIESQNAGDSQIRLYQTS